MLPTDAATARFVVRAGDSRGDVVVRMIGNGAYRRTLSFG